MTDQRFSLSLSTLANKSHLDDSPGSANLISARTRCCRVQPKPFLGAGAAARRPRNFPHRVSGQLTSRPHQLFVISPQAPQIMHNARAVVKQEAYLRSSADKILPAFIRGFNSFCVHRRFQLPKRSQLRPGQDHTERDHRRQGRNHHDAAGQAVVRAELLGHDVRHDRRGTGQENQRQTQFSR